MKLLFTAPQGEPVTTRPQGGFTLVDFLIASTLSIIVIGGIVFAQVTGLKMYNLTKAKLGASDQSRGALNLLVSEIRSAKIIRIGTMSGTPGALVFNSVTEGSNMVGTAIHINSTTNTNNYIRYYLDTADRKLKRTYNGAPATDIVAEFITNNLVFSMENFQGAVLTESQNNKVIGIVLQFFQVQYPVVTVGAGGYYDFYQLRTKVTRRVLE